MRGGQEGREHGTSEHNVSFRPIRCFGKSIIGIEPTMKGREERGESEKRKEEGESGKKREDINTGKGNIFYEFKQGQKY